MMLDYFPGTALYDWGSGLTRAYVVPEAVLVTDLGRQTDEMLGPDLDARRTVMTSIGLKTAAGIAGSPAEPGARITAESANRVTIDAGAGAGGGYLVLLDSFSPDWVATVDGLPTQIARANVLFRAIRLAPGRHVVDFRYRPWAFQAGLAASLIGLVAVAGLALTGVRTRRSPRSV